MVYSAMKLFMEVNPTLFDECSNQYRDEEDNSYKRQQTRDAKWARLKELADQQQAAKRGGFPNGNVSHRPAAGRSPQPSDRAEQFATSFDNLRISDDNSPRAAAR